MALGRGLESLIPQKKSVAPETEKFVVAGSAKQDSVFYIETEKIKPNPYQPRREFNQAELQSLADSMKQYGMLQPLLVSKIEVEVPSGTKVEYQLIAGERRLKAAALAGLRAVPAIIKSADESSKLEMALIENVQRQDLNSLEEALAYRRLIDEFKLTQAEVAQKVGKSREVVGNKVRLLDLPYEIQRDLSDGKISEGHAKVLLALKNPEKQRFLAQEVMVKGMSVRALEELVKVEEAYQHKVKNIDPVLEEYKKTVQDAIGAPVNISGSKEKGRLAINFYSEVDLERIIKKLSS